jgi:hypothetical protein
VTVVRFPPSRFAAVFLLESADGWLVLTLRGHWVHTTLRAARGDARQLAAYLGVPLRDEVMAEVEP